MVMNSGRTINNRAQCACDFPTTTLYEARPKLKRNPAQILTSDQNWPCAKRGRRKISRTKAAIMTYEQSHLILKAATVRYEQSHSILSQQKESQVVCAAAQSKSRARLSLLDSKSLAHNIVSNQEQGFFLLDSKLFVEIRDCFKTRARQSVLGPI